MTEISNGTEQKITPPLTAVCRHCAEEIKPSASVCRYCSRVQQGFLRFSNVLRIGEGMSFLVSVGLLTLAFLNLSSTRQQLTVANQAVWKAQDAISKAESALVKASQTETRVLVARGDVVEVAQTVTEIAEILSHSGEAYGGGLLPENKARLKKRLDLLKDKLSKSEPG